MVQLVIDDKGSIKLTQQILAEMPGKVKTVVRRASVDAIRAIKASIPEAINARYDITKSEIRKQMTLQVKSEDGGMVNGLIVRGNRIPVMKFNVEPKAPPPQAGVPVVSRQTVSIITVKGKAIVGKPNRFVAQMDSGHIGVFRRGRRAKKVGIWPIRWTVKEGKGTETLPIKESLSESVPEMIRTKAIRKQIEDRASEVFVKGVERNIKAVLKGEK
jgi:hypothetical protein